MSASDRTAPYYVGIDLGGTNVKSGVVDDNGRPLSRISLPTHPEKGPEFGVAKLAEAGREAVKAAGLTWDDIAAVGLGSPGTMDIHAGLLLEPPNLIGWENLPIRQKLADLLNKPTTLQNDGNAAAFGEFWAGAGRNARSLVLFTLGTGIGGGIIEEGRLVEGRHSHGAECGHIIIQLENGRVCSCGQKGHLEGYASATALVARAEEALAAGESSSLAASAEITSKAIAQLAAAGDALCQRLMRETAYYLAVGAVSMMHTIDPDLILFSGGMIGAGEPFLAQIQGFIKQLAFPIPASKTIVKYAELGGDAGFIGAAGCARLRHRQA